VPAARPTTGTRRQRTTGRTRIPNTWRTGKPRPRRISARRQSIGRPAKLAILARKQAPDRLGDHQYERGLGRLNWPVLLQDGLFAEERAILDSAFAARTPGDAGVSSGFSTGVRQLTTNMQNKLQANIAGLNQMEYLAAKKFLAGLAIEAQQPLLPERLASAE